MLSSAGLNDFSYVKLSYLTNDLPFGNFSTRILIWSWSSGGETHFLSESVVSIALLSCNSKIDRIVNCSVLQSSPTCTVDYLYQYQYVNFFFSSLPFSANIPAMIFSSQGMPVISNYMMSADNKQTHFQNENFISFVYPIMSPHTNFTADTSL